MASEYPTETEQAERAARELAAERAEARGDWWLIDTTSRAMRGPLSEAEARTLATEIAELGVPVKLLKVIEDYEA